MRPGSAVGAKRQFRPYHPDPHIGPRNKMSRLELREMLRRAVENTR